MTNYQAFARFYDDTLGLRAEWSVPLVRGMIQDAHPSARTLLELGCGTGKVTEALGDSYDAEGLDLSEHMLAVARSKYPRRVFHRASMVNFDLGKQFDVIVCIYDSINHLPSFEDWKRTFRTVERHLSPGGVFVMDMLTEHSYLMAGTEPIHTFVFGPSSDHYMLRQGISGAQGNVTWRFKVFEPTGSDKYILHTEDIEERTYPFSDVDLELRQEFSNVESRDEKGKSPDDESYRVYFVARKRSEVPPRHA